MSLRYLLPIFLFFKFGVSYEVLSLNGQWTVSGTDIESFSATVPGGIYSDLMASGQIKDVFYDKGDTDNFWIGDTDWIYTTTFNVSQELMTQRVVSIVFEGLDTFATITINDEEIGRSENMFRRYVFDIKKILQVGSNTIEVKFDSSVRKARELALNPENPYLIPPECPNGNETAICHVNRIRKMQASFAWDWGPAVPSAGIWKDVYIRAFEDGVLDYVMANSLKNQATGEFSLAVTLFLDCAPNYNVSGNYTFSLELNDTIIVEETFTNLLPTINEYGEISVSTVIALDNSLIKLWNPNGFGDQILYNFTTLYTTEKEVTKKVVRVAFRTIELVQEPLDSGLSFYFKVNGMPLFARGSNVIPINILPESGQDKKTVQKLLESAKEVNMNMLRVWGGGVYESDYFYDLADEYGIMIWQDFMFACALYPADDDYLDNVRHEIRHQIKRLWSHPSIAVWSGNNENEVALATDWYNTSSLFETYKKDYISLYVNLIKNELEDLSAPLGGTTFVTSSPTNGAESDSEGYVAENPYDLLYGDVHVYNYEADPWSLETFPILRFSSEYGYQSWPLVDTLLTATDDVNFTADFWDHRQHHPGGNDQIPSLINQNLNLPEMDVAAFVYFSQIVQAQAIKMETEHYRSFKGRLTQDGTGYTMGALYWQLNDVWVAPTWSGIDFTGKWKMLHYFAKDFFNNMITTGRVTSNNKLEVYAVLDAPELPLEDVKSLVRVYEWGSLDPLVAVEFSVDLNTTQAVLVTTIDAPNTLATAGCGQDYEKAKKKCFFNLNLKDSDNNDLAPSNYVFLGKLKNSDIPSADVQIDSVTENDSGEGKFKIVVTTDVVALFVWLDSHAVKGTFSESGFLQVSPSKTVLFKPEDEALSLEDLKAALTITHLRDPVYL